MTRDKEELEAMVREQFPLIYSMQDPVEADAYASRRNALIDYATAVSAPWLSTEASFEHIPRIVRQQFDPWPAIMLEVSPKSIKSWLSERASRVGTQGEMPCWPG